MPTQVNKKLNSSVFSLISLSKKYTKHNASATNQNKISSNKKHTSKSNIIKKPYLNNIKYPFYRDFYTFSLSKIHIIIKNMKTQLQIYDNPPKYYINYPSSKFKTLNIESINDTSKNKYYIIKSSWNDNIELNSLTDYFSEPCRVQCTFKKHLSPLEYWHKHKINILNNLKKKHQHPTHHNIREEMYLYNKPCNNFRISVCLEVLKLFKPKKWLDISAGWGDRLISALLYKPLDLYCGVDPNPCLHPYYQEMIKTLTYDVYDSTVISHKTKKNLIKDKYILIQDGFETAKLPDTKFDLVFSSPPFFDLEIYSNANTNSVVKYKSENDWFDGFLMPSVNKANEYLTHKGYLILYLGESQGTKYIPKMITSLDKILLNIGMLYYTDGKKIREFYCWQKTTV